MESKNPIIRRQTRKVLVGDIPVGGDSPISVQSMTVNKTYDIDKTLKEMDSLIEAGCQIIRVTVPDEKSAKAIEEYKKRIKIPIVADIHFNYQMALLAVDYGADKIRINPGNIGNRERVETVLTKVKKNNLPIRIGVNAGSLERDLLEKYGYPTAQAMVESAEKHIKICKEFDFEDIIVSLKASDVRLMIESYKLFSKKYDYPLHLGVTEAGPTKSGSIKSSIGLGSLLKDGIGDTIRVSLTDDSIEEVKVGFEILKSLGLASRGVTIISCPTCGRLEVDLFKIAGEMEKKLSHIKKPMSLALMGCAVNGPGEATHADMGVAFGKDGGLLYKDGKKIGKLKEDETIDKLVNLIENEEKKDTG